MSTKDNGGPAFPCDVFDPEVNGPEQHEGMTLRDYFAAKALPIAAQSLKRTYNIELGNDWMWDDEDWEAMAEYSYKIADAMVKERAR